MFKKQEQEPDLEFFTIYDSKAQVYERPWFAKNKNVLIREVINMFKDPQQAQNRFLTNAEDYSLYKIAQFDNTTGQVKSQNLEHVANMHDLRAIAHPEGLKQGIVST